MRIPSIAAAAASVILGLTLTACSEEQVSERLVEEAAEQAGGDVDVDIDGESVKIDTPDGSISTGTELPDGFPSDAVPLVDGEIINSVSGTGSTGAGFSITMTVDAESGQDVVDEAVGLLEDKGFSTTGTQTSGDFVINILESDEYQVSVQAGGEPGNLTVNYIVSPRS